jgi:hypothetical protein
VSTDELKELLSGYVARRPAESAGTAHRPLARLPHLAAQSRPDGSTYVVMEETGDGANPRKLAETNPGHMNRGHDLWNISLKFLCES